MIIISIIYRINSGRGTPRNDPLLVRGTIEPCANLVCALFSASIIA